MVTYAAEETRDPERTIPRALMIGTAVVVVHVPGAQRGVPARCCRSTACSPRRASRPTRRAAAAGRRRRTAISLLVIVSSFGAMSGIILAGPRVYYAMARGRSAVRLDVGACTRASARRPRRSPRRPSGRRCSASTGTYRRALHARRLHGVDLLRRAGARPAAPASHAGLRAGVPGRWGCPAAPLVFAAGLRSRSSSIRSPPIRARASSGWRWSPPACPCTSVWKLKGAVADARR